MTLARLLRRTITVSSLVVAAGVVVAASPALLVAAALVDALQRARLALTRALLMTMVYLVYELAGVLAAAGIWLRGGSAERQLNANFRLQWWWAGGLFDATRALFDLRVEVTGAELARRGPVLVLARHVSVADTLLSAALISRPYGVRLRHVLKRELLWDPCLDIVGHRIPNVFVRRASRQTAENVAAVRRLAEGLGERDGVMIFPEGTRATPASRVRALAQLEASGAATDAQREAARRLVHVLPPHVEGVIALLEAAPRADVVFVAHSGFEGVRTLADLRAGTLIGRRVRVTLWRCAREEIPSERGDRIRWLCDQWRRMDEEVGAAG